MPATSRSCLHATGQRCQGTDPARTVSTTYSRGFLRTVPGFASQISYQKGGMLHQVRHSNNVTYALDTNPADGLRRPFRISTSAGPGRVPAFFRRLFFGGDRFHWPIWTGASPPGKGGKGA